MAKHQSQLLEILYSSGPAAAVVQAAAKESDRGLATELRYPFLALVGQIEMKVALVLALLALAGVVFVLEVPRDLLDTM